MGGISLHGTAVVETGLDTAGPHDFGAAPLLQGGDRSGGNRDPLGIVGVQTAVLLLTFISIERTLKKQFDEQGRRRP